MSDLTETVEGQERTPFVEDDLLEPFRELVDRERFTDLFGNLIERTEFPLGTRIEVLVPNKLETTEGVRQLGPHRYRFHGPDGTDLTGPDAWAAGVPLSDHVALPDYLKEQVERLRDKLVPLWQRGLVLSQQMSTHGHEVAGLLRAAAEVYPTDRIKQFATDPLLYFQVGLFGRCQGLARNCADLESKLVAAQVEFLTVQVAWNIQMWLGVPLPLAFHRSAADPAEISLEDKLRILIGEPPKTEDGLEIDKSQLTPEMRLTDPELWVQLCPDDNIPSFAKIAYRTKMGPSAFKPSKKYGSAPPLKRKRRR